MPNAADGCHVFHSLGSNHTDGPANALGDSIIAKNDAEGVQEFVLVFGSDEHGGFRCFPGGVQHPLQQLPFFHKLDQLAGQLALRNSG